MKILLILKRVFIWCLLFMLVMVLTILIINQYVKNEGSKNIIGLDEAPKADAILVLGAHVMSDGNLSMMLRDRLNRGYDLYQKEKSGKIIVSGDHGQKDYDEVNAMKNYLLSKDIPPENVFMDHAGFSTYESLYRARDIFKVKKVIIVTQRYHLMRAVFIARGLGLEAYGVASDQHNYWFIKYYEKREIMARNKDFLLVKIFKPKPKYLGDAIPVTGDGRLTDDKNNNNNDKR